MTWLLSEHDAASEDGVNTGVVVAAAAGRRVLHGAGHPAGDLGPWRRFVTSYVIIRKKEPENSNLMCMCV